MADALENTWLIGSLAICMITKQRSPFARVVYDATPFADTSGVPTNHVLVSKYSQHGDKPSFVLAAEAAQGSAGRKGSAAWRCECYRCRADTEKVGCPSVY